MINLLFSEVNITLTILFLLLVIYWLFTIFSGLDWDVDFDVDIDVDVDVDVDFDADADIDTHIEGGELEIHDLANTDIDKDQVVKDRRKQLKWWQIVLIHFNFVGLPFMFTLTCWVFFWWVLTLTCTSITQTYNTTFGFVWFFAAILPSLYVTKLFTNPFKSFFNSLNKDGDKEVDFLGRTGTLKDSIKGDETGQVELLVDGNILLINVRSLKGEPISGGQNVLVINVSKDKSIYFVQVYQS